MQRAKDFLVCVILICLIAVLLGCLWLVYNAKTSLGRVTNATVATLMDTRRVILDVGGVTTEVRKTLKVTQDAQTQFAIDTAASAKSLNKDIQDFDIVLANADTVLLNVDSTVEAVRHDEGTVSGDVSNAIQGLNVQMGALEPILSNLEEGTRHLNDAVSNPAIAVTLQNVQGITEDTHSETSLIVGETKQAFKPQNKFVSILKSVAGGTITGAELWYYLSH